MSDDQPPRDLFEGLGIKSPPSDGPASVRPTPAPPPPGAAANMPQGRPRARAQTLLGIPDPAGAITKPELGTVRPSTKLRAAGEAMPVPPPPPRRASLPEIEVAPPAHPAPSAPPPSSSAVSTQPRPEPVVDDAAETHVYPKSPVRVGETEESGQRLQGPPPAKAEHASIDEVLAAKPTPPPPSFGPIPVVPARNPDFVGPPSGHLAVARDRSSRAPVAPNAPSSRAMPAARPVPAPPAPPPAQAAGPHHPGWPSGRQRLATKPPIQQHTLRTKPPPAPAAPPEPAVAPSLEPPRQPLRHAVTTKLPRDAKQGSPVVFLLLAVMALAAAGVFVLMPRASTLVVNVADTKGTAVTHAEVVVDGKKRCDDAPCVVRDLATGSHDVRVSSTGFDSPAPRTVTLDGRRDALADFQLVPAKGTGFKVSGAPNVRLSIDGKDVGVLPVEKHDLEPGEHQLHFSGERYIALDKTISVNAGEVVDLGAVPLKVAKGRVVIELGTPGARVFLVSGGKTRKEVPQLPMAIDFEPSESWELLATKDGFEDFHEPISFADGRADKAITITLSPKAAPSALPSVAVAVAALPQPAPEPAPRSAPAPATPRAPRAGPGEETGGGETVLKINSLPASSIMLDGKAIGSTPQPHVVVTPGSHTVTFVNSELSLKKTITVDVRAGESKPAFARLRDAP